MSQGGEDTSLDILDPVIFVDTKMFGDAKKSDKQAGEKWGIKTSVDKFMIMVDDKNEIETEIRNSRQKTAVKSWVIAKKWSVLIDGKNGGKDLRDKENNKRNSKWRWFKEFCVAGENIDEMKTNDDSGETVDKKNFGKLKEFRTGGREDKRS